MHDHPPSLPPSLPPSFSSSGRMDAGALDKAVHEAKDKGQVPLAVVGTCGTTVLGAFDPLTEIARVCKKYGIWLHVDVSVCVCVCVCVCECECVCVCVCWSCAEE